MPRISAPLFLFVSSLLASVPALSVVPARDTLTINLVAPQQVIRPPVLTTGDFSHAEVTLRGEQAVLSLTLTDDGAERFRALTASHVGQRLAVVSNGHVVGTPLIRVPIRGGRFETTGLSLPEANHLARLINAGPAR